MRKLWSFRVKLLINMEKHLDMPTVEEIQDCVERVLIEEGMADTAKVTYSTAQTGLVQEK